MTKPRPMAKQRSRDATKQRRQIPPSHWSGEPEDWTDLENDPKLSTREVLAAYVRAARRQRSMTPEDPAALAGVSRPWLSNVERPGAKNRPDRRLIEELFSCLCASRLSKTQLRNWVESESLTWRALRYACSFANDEMSIAARRVPALRSGDCDEEADALSAALQSVRAALESLDIMRPTAGAFASVWAATDLAEDAIHRADERLAAVDRRIDALPTDTIQTVQIYGDELVRVSIDAVISPVGRILKVGDEGSNTSADEKVVVSRLLAPVGEERVILCDRNDPTNGLEDDMLLIVVADPTARHLVGLGYRGLTAALVKKEPDEHAPDFVQFYGVKRLIRSMHRPRVGIAAAVDVRANTEQDGGTHAGDSIGERKLRHKVQRRRKASRKS